MSKPAGRGNSSTDRFSGRSSFLPRSTPTRSRHPVTAGSHSHTVPLLPGIGAGSGRCRSAPGHHAVNVTAYPNFSCTPMRAWISVGPVCHRTEGDPRWRQLAVRAHDDPCRSRSLRAAVSPRSSGFPWPHSRRSSQNRYRPNCRPLLPTVRAVSSQKTSDSLQQNLCWAAAITLDMQYPTRVSFCA